MQVQSIAKSSVQKIFFEKKEQTFLRFDQYCVYTV